MNAREQKAALAETVRLTGMAPHDGETLRIATASRRSSG
jgi:hypothetical protein